MKLYKTIGLDEDGVERKYEWSGTQLDARDDRKSLKTTYSDARTVEVEFPTIKPEVIAWLNKNCTGE